MINFQQSLDIGKGTKLRIQADDGIEIFEVVVARISERSHESPIRWSIIFTDEKGTVWWLDESCRLEENKIEILG